MAVMTRSKARAAKAALAAKAAKAALATKAKTPKASKARAQARAPIKSKKIVSRIPSAKIANARRVKKQLKQNAHDKAMEVENESRAAGGYGKACVSPWDIPPGGITKSPAWRKLILRCGGCEPPPPQQRAGAPISGGFPVSEWPPNILVDALRGYWVPDDWGQGIKNTGPGGTYLGWMSPEGKFYYHRKAIEADLGRKLSAVDGFNGIMRSVRAKLEDSGDKDFLKSVLTPKERKHLLPASQFHFGVVSARRATSTDGIHDIMVVEAYFRIAGAKPTWYVDEASLEDYKNLGVDAVVGGKLTPARNMALDVARKQKKVCVQVSDDIGKWEYYDVQKLDFRGETGFQKQNEAVMGAARHTITPVAAAQFMLAKMRSSPLQPQLAGVFPTGNPAMALGGEEFHHHHFILGDFFVVDNSPCRFDESMTLKEDYDFTAAHLAQHGSVLRCNRMFISVKHATNSGGAVSVRDSAGAKERKNIAILQDKWPGVFYMNGKRKDEVIMRWDPKKAPEAVQSRKCAHAGG